MSTPKGDNDNLMLLIGQLVEATKAASDGLKVVSLEVQNNAKALVAVSATVDSLEKDLTLVDQIVRDSKYDGNLVSTSAKHKASLDALHDSVQELKRSVGRVKADVEKLGLGQSTMKASNRTLWTVGMVVGWAITTIVALYGALKGP